MNGIGGSTIAQAQSSISYAEFVSWAAYRAKRGSLNVGLRTEYAVALIACLYARSKGSKSKLHDFAPHMDEPEITLDSAMKEWS